MHFVLGPHSAGSTPTPVTISTAMRSSSLPLGTTTTDPIVPVSAQPCATAVAGRPSVSAASGPLVKDVS